MLYIEYYDIILIFIYINIAIYVSGSKTVVRVLLVVRGRPVWYKLHIIFAVALILFIFCRNTVKCKLLLVPMYIETLSTVLF